MRRNLFAGEGGSIYLFALCGASILGTVFYYILARTGSFDGMSVTSWVSYAVTQIAFVAVVLIYSRVRRIDLPVVAKLRPTRSVGQYLLLLPIAIVSIAAFFPLYLLFASFLGVMGYHTGNAVAMPVFSNFGVFVLAVFVMALLPAIGEELLMRGTVLPAMTSRGTWFGIFISALLFALMHNNPMQTVYQFCLGVVLALVFMSSRSVVPCMILHFLSNLITLILTAYLPQVDRIIIDLGAYNWLTGAVSFVVGTMLLVLLLFFYHRAGNPRKSAEDYTVSDAGIVFEEYSLRAYTDARPVREKKPNVFAEAFRFLGSLFTRRGWRAAERELIVTCDIPYVGKTQPMLGVWLAIGFSAVYWVLALLGGLL